MPKKTGVEIKVSRNADLKAQKSSCGSKKYPTTILFRMVSLQAACNVFLLQITLLWFSY